MRLVRVTTLLLNTLGLGCGGAAMADWWRDEHGGGPPSRMDGRYVTDSYAEAGGAATLASVLWGVAGGCKIEGCEPPLRCNAKSELCEPARCGEGHSCPVGTRCNHHEHVCEP